MTRLPSTPKPSSAAAIGSTSINSTQAHASQSDNGVRAPEPFVFLSTSHATTFAFNPDIAIPSVERDSSQPKSPSTPSNGTARARNPSISVTPPASGAVGTPFSGHTPTDRTSPTHAVTINNIDELIGGLKLSAQSDTPDTPSNGSASTSAKELHSSSYSGATTAGDGQPLRGPSANSIVDGIEHLSLERESSQPNIFAPRNHLRPMSPGSDMATDEETPRRRRRGSSRRSSSSTDNLPHDVALETPPHERFHDSGFQSAFTRAKGLVAGLMEVLESSSLHREPESAIQKLYQQATDLRRFQNPSTRIVGLVGDSGVGKSSLMNSLLDFKDLARTSNSGAACTCVVTEYLYHKDDSFIIEVEYFTVDEIRAQITELLQAYRYYHLHSEIVPQNGQGGDTLEKKAKEEDEALEKKAKLAEDTFRAMFRNRLAEDEGFLIRYSETTALQKLINWTRQQDLPLMEGASNSNVTKKEILATVEDCSQRLMELTSESNSPGDPSVWPFIQKIKVYLKAHILSKGLILADLPGLRDLNSARLKITENYVRNCHEILAVCCIGRATTDVGVESVIELAKKANLSNVGIICTKSDDIQAHEAERDWKGEPAKNIRQMRDRLEDLDVEYEDIELQIKELGSDSETEDENQDGYGEYRRKLLDKQRRIRRYMGQLDFRLKSYIIDIRNQKVTGALQKAYGTKIPGGNLKVFCISNTLYWDHRFKPRRESLPFLQLSCIFDVRRHCLGILAESQLQAAREYITDGIPALLGSVELWVESGAGSANAEAKQAIRKALDKISQALDTLILPASAIATSMENEFKRLIYHFMRQRTDEWSQAAEQESYMWQSWHHSSYAAFCRKYGNHCTAVAGRHSWNDEAIEKMVVTMVPRWREFRQKFQALQDENLTSIESCFNRSVVAANQAGVGARSLRTLSYTLGHRKGLLLYDLEQVFGGVERDLSTIGASAFTGIRTSMVGGLLEASYNAANAQYSSGSDRRRKNIMTEGFSNEQLFESLRTQFRAKFSALACELQNQMQEKITAHLLVVGTDLDILRHENVATESENNPQFRRRIEEEVKTVKERMVDISVSVRALT